MPCFHPSERTARQLPSQEQSGTELFNLTPSKTELFFCRIQKLSRSCKVHLRQHIRKHPLMLLNILRWFSLNLLSISAGIKSVESQHKTSLAHPDILSTHTEGEWPSQRTVTHPVGEASSGYLHAELLLPWAELLLRAAYAPGRARSLPWLSACKN